MSDEWVDPRVESRRRKRAAIGLLGIALLAGLVVILGLTFVKTGSAPKTASGPRPLDSLLNTPSRTPTKHARSSKPAPSSSPGSSGARSSMSASPSPSPTHTKHPVASCPSSSPCMLSTDGGDLIGAINKYRLAHGVPSVPGKVSPAAERCSVGNGDSGNCPQYYYWEPVSRWKGTDVVEKIVNNGGGAEYLLNSSVKSIEVGWALDPTTRTFYATVVTHY